MDWKTIEGSPLVGDIRETVEKTILRESGNGYKVRICIGTDSQVHSHTINFATVIVFLREKQGGFMFCNKSSVKRNGMRIKERMIMEVGKSVEIAYQLNEILLKYGIPLEVHADINQDEEYLSNAALKTALGYIKGMGFDFKVKPDAFASSSCADRLV